MLGRRHTRAEYLAVALITAGVALFSLKRGAFQEESGKDSGDAYTNLIGLALVRCGAGFERVCYNGRGSLRLVVFNIIPGGMRAAGCMLHMVYCGWSAGGKYTHEADGWTFLFRYLREVCLLV